VTDVDADKRAIAEVLGRYCRAWDRGDVKLALTLWHPDGTAQYPGEETVPVATMIPQRLLARRKLGVTTSHQVTNMVIVVRGDLAVSEAYGTAWLVEPASGGRVVQHHYLCRYLDRWSRRGGRWAIDHRRVLLDASTVQTLKVDRGVRAALGQGHMGPQDPSYPHFAALGCEH
jgi:hypothetical protein